MAKVTRLDIERLARQANESMIVEQAVAFNAGLAMLVMMEKTGRDEFIERLRGIWESYDDSSFERALGWIFFLRLRLWEMRLAKAARKIPGVYELFGKSIISHWFQSLTLKEIDLVDDPIRAFGAPVEYLEKRGIKSFQNHLRAWRETRIKGAA